MEKHELFKKALKITHSFKKNLYEKEAWKNGQYVLGIDEVGRGCLAGPVVTAALILKPSKNIKISILQDSKTLSQEELQISYEWIMRNSWYSVSVICNKTIDSQNIYRATLTAMRRATEQLLCSITYKPTLVVTDAMPLELPHFDGSVLYFTQGESKSASIAAASIVAKVTRDALMKRISKSFPVYDFDKHKGYATQTHTLALKNHGPSILHRSSFSLPDTTNIEKTLQTSLFHE